MSICHNHKIHKYGFLFRYPLCFGFYFFFFFIVGVVLAFVYKNANYVAHLIIGTICIFILALVAMFVLKYRNMLIFIFLFSISSLILGYSYTISKYYHSFTYPIEEYSENPETTIKSFRAKVISYEGIRLNKHTYTVDIQSVYDGSNWHDYNSRFRLYNYGDYRLGINDIITSTAKLKLYKNIFTNETDKDFEILSALEKKSLVGVASAYKYKDIIVIREGFSLINYLNDRFIPIRFFVKEALGKHMNSLNYSIAQCLLVGDKNTIPYPIQEIFQNVGISHILSVSGLHISIIYFLMFTLLSIFPIPLHIRLIIVSLVILVLYLPITLYSIPILRASLMMTIATIAIILDRTKNILNVLLLTAFIIILHNPSVVKEVSFQLSFLATFSLIIYMPMVAKLVNPLPHILRVVIQFFAVGIFANIMLLPLVSAHFGTIVLTSIIANIYAIPLTFLIIVVDIIIVVLYKINPEFTIWFAKQNDTLVDMMMVFSRWLGEKNILYFEYRMEFNKALILTFVMVIVSLTLSCLFNRKLSNDLMKS